MTPFSRFLELLAGMVLWVIQFLCGLKGHGTQNKDMCVYCMKQFKNKQGGH